MDTIGGFTHFCPEIV